MFCRYCGHEQSDGAFCDKCGKPMGLETQTDITENSEPVTESSLIKKKSKVPIIAAGVVCAAAIGIGAAVILRNGNDKPTAGKEKAVTTTTALQPEAEGMTESKTEKAEDKESSAAPAETGSKTDTSKAEEVAAPEIDYGWIEAYIGAAEEFANTYDTLNLAFKLLYMNDDSIPEMFVYDSYMMYGNVYTYVDGKAVSFQQMDSIYSNLFTGYKEKTGEYYVCDRDGAHSQNGIMKYYTLGSDGTVETNYIVKFEDDEYTVDGDTLTQGEFEKKYGGYTFVMNVEDIVSISELKKTLRAFDPDHVEEKIEVLSATDILNMTKNELDAIIGNDYRVTMDEFSGSGGYVYGITSDTYFPNVMISVEGDTEQEILNNFKYFSGGSHFASLCVNEGGLIGNGVKIGDSYNDMLTKVDCLNGVGTYQTVSTSIIDGYCVNLSFNTNAFDIGEKRGSNVVDLYSEGMGDARSVTSFISSNAPPSADTENSYYKKATLTGDDVALRAAPYKEAVSLWSMEKGATVYVGNKYTDAKGEEWYEIAEYRTSDGVWKRGYAHAEYISLDQY